MSTFVRKIRFALMVLILPCSLASAQVGQPVFHQQSGGLGQSVLSGRSLIQNAPLQQPVIQQSLQQNALVQSDATCWSEAMAQNGVYTPMLGETSDTLAVIGGGRSIPRAIFDRNWSRMALVYGGFGSNYNNGGDIFDGRADVETGIFGVDIGRRHSDYLRSSIDFTHRSGTISSGAGDVTGDMDIYSLLKNFHLDFPTRSCGLQPYLGLGIGFAYTDSVGTFGGAPAQIQGDTSFAWQAIGGVAYKIGRMSSLYAEYRRFSTSDMDLHSGGAVVNQGNFSSHDVLFGLRLGF